MIRLPYAWIEGIVQPGPANRPIDAAYGLPESLPRNIIGNPFVEAE